MPVKVVIYARGTTDRAAEQIERCQELCARRGYQVVAIATDAPGSYQAWQDAQKMVTEDGADRVVFASSTNIPDHLESVSGEIPHMAVRAAVAKRIRPMRRPGEGA